MSPEQCRAARERLNWSQDDLAAAAGAPISIVADFENGETVLIVDCLVAMREVLESVGIGFPFVIDNAALIPCGVTYSSPDKSEAH